MSGQDDDSGDKQHEPTQRKLEEARRKGQTPRSQDLTTAAAYAGALLAFAAAGGWTIDRLGRAGRAFLDRPDQLAEQIFGASAVPAGSLLGTVGAALTPVIAIPAVFALAAIAVQRGFTITAENLAPRLSRISPSATAAEKFGRSGLFEFAKSTAKLVLVSAVLAVFLDREWPRVAGLLLHSPGVVSAEMGRMLVEFLAVVVAVSLAVGLLDFLWQRLEHLRRNRMSHKELMDETKESEGDPHTRSERRRRATDIATNRMLADVPKADVVIVNPSHYAVALKWSRKRGSAPVCVAKGVDEIAARIREAAATAGVPVHRDPPTARALHATVEVGEEIRPDHYRAVAAAIRFAERIRARARGRIR